MTRLLLALVIPLFFTQFVVAQSDREILRLGRGTANALDWRPDGAVLAVGSGTGVWLYDENFETLAHLEDEQTGNVRSVQWNHNGGKLASANVNRDVRIWAVSDDVTQVESLRTIAGAGTSVRWSPDGESLASSSWMRESHLKIWDTDTGDLILEIPDVIGEIAWSPDSQMLAGSIQNDSQPELKIWDAATGEILLSLQGAINNLSFPPVAWSPDGTMLAAGGSGPGGLYIWDTTTGNLIVNKSPILSDILSFDQVVWSANGDQLFVMGNAVSAPSYSNLAVWDTTTWEIVAHNGYHGDGMWELALHPDGGILTSVTQSSLLINWDVKTAETLGLPRLHNPVQYLLSWRPDGSQLATTNSYSSENAVLIWSLTDSATTEIDQPAQILEEGVFPWVAVTSLRWNDNNELITISESSFDLAEFNFRSVERWNPDSGESRGVIYATEYGRGEAAWNSDFTLIAQEDYDYTHVEIRRIDTDELLLSIPMDMNVVAISWVRHDQALSITTWNPETNEYFVELWDSESGERLDITEAIQVSPGRTWTSPDNRIRAVATLDDLRFLDTSTGEIVEVIPITGIAGMAWSPDATRLALGMSDGTIRIWDVSDITRTE